MASYYTRAWFDLQLRGKRTGYDRLTATTFDDSVDKHLDRRGRLRRRGGVDPADPYSGNVPVRDRRASPCRDAVSFYYLSSYALTHPGTGTRTVCASMRAGC